MVDSATMRRNAVTDRYAALSATMRDSALAPARFSSSSSWARTRDIRQSAASAAESRNADGDAEQRGEDECGHQRDHQVVGRPRPARKVSSS